MFNFAIFNSKFSKLSYDNVRIASHLLSFVWELDLEQYFWKIWTSKKFLLTQPLVVRGIYAVRPLVVRAAQISLNKVLTITVHALGFSLLV